MHVYIHEPAKVATINTLPDILHCLPAARPFHYLITLTDNMFPKGRRAAYVCIVNMTISTQKTSHVFELLSLAVTYRNLK